VTLTAWAINTDCMFAINVLEDNPSLNHMLQFVARKHPTTQHFTVPGHPPPHSNRCSPHSCEGSTLTPGFREALGGWVLERLRQATLLITLTDHTDSSHRLITFDPSH
jgi:hypothetical protein